MIKNVIKRKGVIDFELSPGSVEIVKGNTYDHCDFTRLGIVGNYTPVGYVEFKEGMV